MEFSLYRRQTFGGLDSVIIQNKGGNYAFRE